MGQLILQLIATSAAAHSSSHRTYPDPRRAPAPSVPNGMVWIPGGLFTMGSTDPLARPDDQLHHTVQLKGLWIDRTEVTNAHFRAFVDATGSITIAERTVDWEELKSQVPERAPRPCEISLGPGSLVFVKPRATDSRVRRGGSFLCNDSSCASDRPSARMGCASDTGMSHIGFRCVTDQPAPAQSHHAHTD